MAKTSDVWYEHINEEGLLGTWIEETKFLFWKKRKYRVEKEDGSEYFLESTHNLDRSCELIEKWEET